MAIRLTSMEQLAPFATAAELLAKKKEPVVSVAPGSTVLAAWVEGDARTVVTRRLGLDGMPMAAPVTLAAATGVGRISLGLLMDGYALA